MKRLLYYWLFGIFLIYQPLPCSTPTQTGHEADVENLLIDEIQLSEADIVNELPDQNNEMIINNGLHLAKAEVTNPIKDSPEEADDNDDDERDDEIIERAKTRATNPHETGPHTRKVAISDYAWRLHWDKHRPDEGDEPNRAKMSQLSLVSDKDITFNIGGRLKDELFFYGCVHTLRTDYHDQNDFIRHRLNLDMALTQGTKKYGAPASEACVRLCNYVFWQKESNYAPFVIDEITVPSLDNVTIAKDVHVRPLIPLIFVEQAWFKLNFDVFAKTFHDKPTYLKVGYFPYIVGRGVTLGFHDDLAVDYLGWAGEGGFTRYPFMPPGILFRTSLTEKLSWDVYYNLWRETNASLDDTLKPERWSRLDGTGPERGSGKDRSTWVTKFDYSTTCNNRGNLLLQPYLLFVNAPEQTVEVAADASSKLLTIGFMADWHSKNWNFNLECAGQTGHQHMHAIDRNEEQLTRGSNTGNAQTTFSHIIYASNDAIEANPAVQTQASVSRDNSYQPTVRSDFRPDTDYLYLADAPQQRNSAAQGATFKLANGTFAHPAAPAGAFLQNTTTFGNNRFRKPYKLTYQGFMALADLSYEFEDHPFRLAAALGYISGDKYPYNDEVNSHYNGFIPMRSRYRGLAVQNFLIFDRLVIPRPLNISYRTLYAYNNRKDLSNLEYIGLGLTWFPFNNDRKRMSATTDLMFLWEATTLHKWDKNGTNSDPSIETQLVRLRNTVNGNPTLFSGWESPESARRMLGTELDIKTWYRLVDHCDFITRVSLFFPGQLYKDLDGQPNQMTQRVDHEGYLRYDSLGHTVAFAFVFGLDYKF